MRSIVVRDELASGLLAEVGRLPDLDERFYAITLTREFSHPLVESLTAAARRMHKDAAPVPAQTPAPVAGARPRRRQPRGGT